MRRHANPSKEAFGELKFDIREIADSRHVSINYDYAIALRLWRLQPLQ